MKLVESVNKLKDMNQFKQGPYYDGLEIGSVSVKWVRTAEDGTTIAGVIRHEGKPQEIVREIVAEHIKNNGSNVVITGQSTKAMLNFPYRSESECLERSVSYYNVRPDILLMLGGESFTVYTLKDGLIKNVICSSKCAAGTGEFVLQQFKRMDFSIEEGLKVGEKGCVVPLATRCSVHCKSDATHKLNKGECRPEDIAASLMHDLAQKVCKMIASTHWPSRRVLVAGGLSRNRLFITNLRAMLQDSEILVLKASPYLETFGASLYASVLQQENDHKKSDRPFNRAKPNLNTLPPLKNAESLLDFRVRDEAKNTIKSGATYILGIDAGSTTTKAVLYNIKAGAVDAGCYIRTHGNPISAVQNCIKQLIQHIGGREIRIVQAAVTGSGREMVSVYLDNCFSYNEILAHARAAKEAVPHVDTVFEIGGQDSKFISFLEGIPVDYAMNEGCSAGTGSFLEESVSVDMGIPVPQISALAQKSEAPFAFGERCAAFINTDMRNALQNHAKREDVIAGLVYAIVDNYISRVVGVRSVGKILLFQGGVALNRSVALAMAARTGQSVVVPENPEMMGCVGCALMTSDLLAGDEVFEKEIRLDDLVKGSMSVSSTFTCHTCDNNCEIRNISIRNRSYPFGGLCPKYDLVRHKRKTRKARNLIELRNQIMFEEFGPREKKSPRGSIGLPMALTSYECFPFYTELINELGYNVVLSNPSKEGQTKTPANTCYPCEMAHGAVYDLIKRDTDYIFLPHFIESEAMEGYSQSLTCPSTSNLPDLICNAFEGASLKMLSPHIGLSKSMVKTTYTEIERLGSLLGIGKNAAVSAAQKAYAHYHRFITRYQEVGRAELAHIGSEPAIIIAGRPYILFAKEANLSLDRKIAGRGYHVVPADIFSVVKGAHHPRNMWYATQQIMNAVLYAKKMPNLNICLVSCFSCGPDAGIYHMIRRHLAGEVFCYLEIDSHTAHAGFDTRVGAFLDIVEGRNRNGKT